MIKKNIKNILLYILLILGAFIMIGPLVWLLVVSLMPGENVLAFPPPLPTFDNISLDNYTGVVQFLDFPRYFLNSIIIVTLSIILNVLLSSTMAYPLAKFDFKGKSLISKILLFTIVVPAAAGMIVNYLTINNLNLIDNYLGVVLPTACTVINVVLMRQAYTQVPNEIRESGLVDGTSEFRIWLKLIFPMVRPTVAVVVLFTFMAQWNDFIWSLIVLKGDKLPLAAGLTVLNSQFTYNFGWIAASTVISILPMLLIFIFTQKYFVKGLAGSVKG